ncbi:hypothetical protein Trydic_g1107 [Trypoxylus dichotomus]
MPILTKSTRLKMIEHRMLQAMLICISPNSANSEIPIMETEDNEVENTENNEPGISNIDSIDHFDYETPETSLYVILPVLSTSTVSSIYMCT